MAANHPPLPPSPKKVVGAPARTIKLRGSIEASPKGMEQFTAADLDRSTTGPLGTRQEDTAAIERDQDQRNAQIAPLYKKIDRISNRKYAMGRKVGRRAGSNR